MKNIGFVGIGVMGSPMAKNLLNKGHTLFVCTRTKSKAQPLLDLGAHWCDTPAQCAAQAEVLITMVGYPRDVEEVYLSAEGILQHAKPGTYLIDMTTSDPALAQKIHQEAKARGLSALDAPVSGGDVGAQNATLSIMVGGEWEDFEACLPVLEALGKNIVYAGRAGAGQHTKMTNQIAIAGALAGVCEALAYGQKNGLDLHSTLATISKGAAGSWQMDYNAPKIIQSDFSPGFYLKHLVKDLNLALAQPGLPVTQLVRDMLADLENQGLGNLGTQALIQHYDWPAQNKKD